jgi:AraC-like DNA-binding protein
MNPVRLEPRTPGQPSLTEYIHNTLVFRDDGFAIENVCCRAESPDCSATEYNNRPSIAFVRSGVFRKHVGRDHLLADANHIVFFNASEEYRVSHPVAGGDDCTSLWFDAVTLENFSREVGSRMASPDCPFPLMHLVASSACAMRLHRLLNRIANRSMDSFEVHEAGLALLGAVSRESREALAVPSSRVRSSTSAAHRRIVDAARELIAANPGAPLTLQTIGDKVGVSPYHLVRIFRRHTGLPLHRYRNQLRLRLALEHVSQGHRDLTSVALRLGFASHSHFTDAFRREFHLSPSAFRRL